MTYEPTGYACIDHLDLIPESQRGCLYVIVMCDNGVDLGDALSLAPRLGLCTPGGPRYADCGSTGKELGKYAPVMARCCRDALKSAAGDTRLAGHLCRSCPVTCKSSRETLEAAVVSGLYRGLLPYGKRTAELLAFRIFIPSARDASASFSIMIYREIYRAVYRLSAEGLLSGDAEGDRDAVSGAVVSSVRDLLRRKQAPLTDATAAELLALTSGRVAGALSSRPGAGEVTEAVGLLKMDAGLLSADKGMKLGAYRNPDMPREMTELLSGTPVTAVPGCAPVTEPAGDVPRTDAQAVPGTPAFLTDPSLGVTLSDTDAAMSERLTPETLVTYRRDVLDHSPVIHAETVMLHGEKGLLVFGQPFRQEPRKPAFIPLALTYDAFWEWLLTDTSHDVITVNLCLLLRSSGRFRGTEARAVTSLSSLLHVTRGTDEVYPVGAFGQADGGSFIRSCFLKYRNVCGREMAGLTEHGKKMLGQFMNYEGILSRADDLSGISDARYDNLVRETFARSRFRYDLGGRGLTFFRQGTLIRYSVDPPVADAGEHGGRHENFYVMFLHYLSQKRIMLLVDWTLLSITPRGVCIFLYSRRPENVDLACEAVFTTYHDMSARLKGFSLPPLVIRRETP